MTKKHIYTVAGNGVAGFSGDGGPATSAEMSTNEGIAVEIHGNIVVSDDHNNRIRIVAKVTGTFYGIAMTSGDIYTLAGSGTLGYAGDGGPATSAELFVPTSVAADTLGNLFIVDYGNCRIRKVSA